jgi:hypothetical protein
MRSSLSGLPLRAALRRGALVAAANWPLILLHFALASVYRLAVGVPVVGGVFVVAVLAGADVRALLAQDLRAAIGQVAAALANHPDALWTFLVAVGVVAVGGASVVFLVEAGTRCLLVRGERRIGDRLGLAALREAHVFDIPGFFDGVRRFGGRFLLLGAWLCVAYAGLGVLAVLGLHAMLSSGLGAAWDAALGVGGLAVTAATVVAMAALNLWYALLQVIITSDDCRLGEAMRRLRAFVMHDARQVAGVFGVVLALVVLASAISLVATAGLALVAWVPIVGLAVVPLQMAAWLVRGVVFHYMELGAWSAYQSQYRRYGEMT